MKLLNRYSKSVPYLYFVTLIIFWFTDINQQSGIIAYPILLFTIPFFWQLIKPNSKLNFALGLTFVCLSSYLIMANLSNFNINLNNFILSGWAFVIVNFVMALWILKNSARRTSY